MGITPETEPASQFAQFQSFPEGDSPEESEPWFSDTGWEEDKGGGGILVVFL